MNRLIATLTHTSNFEYNNLFMNTLINVLISKQISIKTSAIIVNSFKNSLLMFLNDYDMFNEL